MLNSTFDGKIMKNVFISRPTWVAPEFEKGLEGFMALIKSHELLPRTLGVSDHPTDSPLDEVISILDECVGAIILGYPQIEIEKGRLKNEPIGSTPFLLATEWNHIEAGLAYARGLPLLVLHHVNVRRGIFDRGALNKFLHQVDLSDNAWFSKNSILGAFSAWKKKLRARASDKTNKQSKTDLDFERRSGTLISKETGLRYCQKCYHNTPSKEVELLELEEGWKCSVCSENYPNPDWNPDTIPDFENNY
jgi:hypothetical protein